MHRAHHSRTSNLLSLALGGTLLLAVACSSSDGTDGQAPLPCNVQYDCGAGKTCWTGDGNSYSCVYSGIGTAAASCVAGFGPPACGDRLYCVAFGSPTNGKCLYWCDDSMPCPSGGTCTHADNTAGITVGYCQ